MSRALRIAFCSEGNSDSRIDEAKQLFEACVYSLLARTRRQRKQIDPGRFQADIADEVPLDMLRRLPAFQRFEDRLTLALIALGYVTR